MASLRDQQAPATATAAPHGPHVRHVSRPQKRADIQRLRALAVGLVIVHHFFPTVLDGGYVGVDVFFVISGYLITLQLLREHRRTGGISVGDFYVRRIRRLMPAALATTTVTLVVSWFVMDPVRLASTLRDASWTGAYLANYRFALEPGGYFATGQQSPLLHTWSLAVEEQYYLVWPALLLALTALARGRSAAVPAFLGVVICGSLTASVMLTGADSPQAYYSIATRAWELAIGSAIAYAVLNRRTMRPGGAATAAVWAGLAMIVVAALTYTTSTPFPGYTALLPTVGTALAIWAGTDRAPDAGRVPGERVVQAVGDASYSLYLWHWPVLVLGVEVVGSSRLDRTGLVAAALVLGFLGHRLVERPTSRLGAGLGTRRFLALGLAATALAVGAPALMAAQVATTGGAAVTTLDAITSTATVRGGVISLARTPAPAPPDAVPGNVAPPLLELEDDLAEVFTNGCYSAGVTVCDGGDPDGDVHVVLTGDSHAGQWWPGLEKVALERGWKVSMVGKNACPLADVRVFPTDVPAPWPECDAWQRDALAAVVDLDPDVVLYDNHAQGYLLKPGQARGFAGRWRAGVRPTLDELTDHSTVVALGQTPSFPWEPGTCLAEHLDEVAACSVAAEDVRLPLVRDLAEELALESGALYVDPVQVLCDDVCPMMDRNRIVYRDATHLTASYSESLAASLGAVVEAALDEQ